MGSADARRVRVARTPHGPKIRASPITVPKLERLTTTDSKPKITPQRRNFSWPGWSGTIHVFSILAPDLPSALTGSAANRFPKPRPRHSSSDVPDLSALAESHNLVVMLGSSGGSSFGMFGWRGFPVTPS